MTTATAPSRSRKRARAPRGLPAIGVCGFGMCGTTMTMHMLRAGGVPWAPCLDELGEAGPLVPHVVGPGRAVKTLLWASDQETRLPRYDWRFVWLDRDPEAQARSWALRYDKLGAWREISWRPDEPEAKAREFITGLRDEHLARLRRRGRVLVLDFESVKANPRRAAAQLAAFVKPLDLHAAASAAVVNDPLLVAQYRAAFEGNAA